MNFTTISILFFSICLLNCSTCKSSPKSDNELNQDSVIEQEKSTTSAEVSEKSDNVTTEEYEDGNSMVQITIIENTVITGKIVVLGDSMFSELVLVTKDNEHYTFRPEDKEDYWAEQAKTIIIRGKV